MLCKEWMKRHSIIKRRGRLSAHILLTTYSHIRVLFINPCAAEVFVTLFRHLKLELLTQFPALNDEKYYHQSPNCGI